MAVSITPHLDYPPLLPALADGHLRSGVALARELGVSRAAVWKGVERLRRLGVPIEAAARRGYRLPQGIELLDARAMLAELAPERARALRRLELLFEVESTNTLLLERPPPPPGVVDACLAELQHAGRGRRGRRWIAPFGSSIVLSAACLFEEPPRGLSALSLAVGIAVARALERLGAAGLALKWPNDLWFRTRKVGGILIELKAEASGPVQTVIGIGLNVRLSETQRLDIEAGGVRVAAIADAAAGGIDRSRVAGAVLDELIAMLERFATQGFAAVRAEWAMLDALAGRPVRLLTGHATVEGISHGVDEEGALILETAGGLRKFVSGEASLRAIEGDR